MKRIVTTILCVLAMPLFGSAAARAQTRVYAKVDAQTNIYPGQDFVYSIVVEGGAKPSKIDIAPIAQFNPRRAGSGTSMQTVNDRTTVSYSENYAITAQEAGTMTLPGVTVVVNGQTYTTNAVEVPVSTPGTTDRIALALSLSETTCYVGQPVVMTVKWTVTAQVKDASFDVPVFKSDDFYIEDMAEGDSAWAKQQVSIHGVPVVVAENRETVKGVEAAVISFSKVLIPKRPGRLTLDPVSVSVNMAVGRVRSNDFFSDYRMQYKRFSVQSEPVSLEVRPLPETDQPAQFYGLVGRYTITASATPTAVSVGDPITLTLRIGGNPYLKPVRWPDLESQRDLADNFKIPAEKASPVLENGEKVFTQTIRANNDAVAEIPPIPLAFFDPDRGDYVVARTAPVKLEVAPTKVLTNADVEGTVPGSVGRKVQALKEGFSANYYGPEVLVNQTFSPLSAVTSPGYAALWSIPLAALVVSMLVKLSTRTSPEGIARRRRRQACAQAVKQLRMVASAQPGERHERLIEAVKGYVGARFDKAAGSLTADDCYAVVAAATDDVQVAGQFKAKVAEFEAARYASMDASVGTSEVEEAIALIHQVEKKSKR